MPRVNERSWKRHDTNIVSKSAVNKATVLKNQIKENASCLISIKVKLIDKTFLRSTMNRRRSRTAISSVNVAQKKVVRQKTKKNTHKPNLTRNISMDILLKELKPIALEVNHLENRRTKNNNWTISHVQFINIPFQRRQSDIFSTR